MDNKSAINHEQIEFIDEAGYTDDFISLFQHTPAVAKPLFMGAKAVFDRIEQMLYTAPAFISAIKAAVPEEILQAILTDDQKSQLARGTLKLMTKKDGSIMANLVNPETNRIVSTISLKKIHLSGELSQAVASYATQMQLAQIAEQIQLVQIAIEEVRQGQENDRLATAYSCQQKLLQAMAIINPQLKAMALLQLVSDAEDSRNLLMLSQKANASFLQNQPESIWGKLVSGSTPEKIHARLNELRDSLAAVNMVSLVEAMAYQELGETGAAQLSLQYYADYIQKTYLDCKGFVDRLDMIDPSPKLYWSETLPEIAKQIQALPHYTDPLEIKENNHGTARM